MSTSGKHRIAILISGRGSNMRALIEATHASGFPVKIHKIIADRADAEGLKYAIESGIDTSLIEYGKYSNRLQFESAIDEKLRDAQIDIICLAGFMRLLTADFVNRWHNRILNIHPSLLPAFKGLHTHVRVINAGVRISGCTVHVVRAEIDNGPIIAQAAVPVLPEDTPDTLAARVLAAEHKLYPLAITLFTSGQVSIDGEKAQYKKCSLVKNSSDIVILSPSIS